MAAVAAMVAAMATAAVAATAASAVTAATAASIAAAVTAATAASIATAAVTAATPILGLSTGYPGQAVRNQYGRRRQNRANSYCQ
jgi:hypothetical protein